VYTLAADPHPLAPLVTPALVVSVLALLFTVLSFWWIQARRGRLETFAPHSYAGSFSLDDLLLSLPMVPHNTGPAPIVVLDFRLRIDKTDEQAALAQGEDERALLPFYMSWRAIQPKLEPAPPGGGRVMPSPIPLEGRRAVERFIEFSRRSPALLPLNGPYTATVEVKLAHRPSWRPIVRFPLHTELHGGDPAAYIPRTNDPAWEP